jgi:hypothetical protein
VSFAVDAGVFDFVAEFCEFRFARKVVPDAGKFSGYFVS